MLSTHPNGPPAMMPAPVTSLEKAMWNWWAKNPPEDRPDTVTAVRSSLGMAWSFWLMVRGGGWGAGLGAPRLVGGHKSVPMRHVSASVLACRNAIPCLCRHRRACRKVQERVEKWADW